MTGYFSGNSTFRPLLRAVGRYWPVPAILLIFIGGLSYHSHDYNVFWNATHGLLVGHLYTHSGASYFPPMWYLFATPVVILSTLGVYDPVLFPWIVAALFVTALAVAGTYGSQYIDDGELFMGAVLLNPLTLGVIIWSQSDAFVALGVLVALISAAEDRWVLFGAAAAAAASIKYAPAFVILPAFALAWDHRYEIITGAGVVGSLCLATLVMHGAIPMVFDTSHSLGFRTSRVWYTNPLWPFHYLFDTSLLGVARLLTIVAILAGLVWALTVDAPIEVRLLAPFVMAVVFYPAPYTYRWLPIIVAAFWIANRYHDYDIISNTSWQYAWTGATLGAIYLAFDAFGPLSTLNSSVFTTIPFETVFSGLPQQIYFWSLWLIAIAHIAALMWVARKLSGTQGESPHTS